MIHELLPKKLEKDEMIFYYLSLSTEETKKKNSFKSYSIFCGIAGIRVWLRFITINFHQYLSKLSEDVSDRFWLEKTFKVIEI